MLLVGAAVVSGLLLLAFAPDRFVAGSVALADRWGVSRVVIGAVVVGFGTSSPELLVSGIAAAGGEPEVGLGNIVGSNMANLGLIVAVAALVGQVAVPAALYRRELPLVLVATVAFAVVVQDGLSRLEGVLLACGLVVSLWMIIRHGGDARTPADPAQEELAAEVGELVAEEGDGGVGRLVLDTLAGLAGTLVGAQLLVSGAVDVAERLDLSGGFVGLTIVALGTSLPELVTAVAAARAGEDQLILGNVLGSNLFNCLAVGALVALAGGGSGGGTGVPFEAVGLMLLITALATVAMARHQIVTRGEATALLVAYVAFLPLLG
jgi:cation:H+ antiporter